MPETWDLNTAEGRRAAWEAGLLDEPPAAESSSRRGTGEGRPGVPRSTKRQGRDDLTPAQQAFLAACAAHGLPEPVPEYPWGGEAGRKFRADYLFLDWLLVEVQGGIFGRGRPCPACGRRPPGAHSSIKDLLRDNERYRWAAVLGYSIFPVTPGQVNDGSAFALIARALEANP